MPTQPTVLQPPAGRPAAGPAGRHTPSRLSAATGLLLFLACVACSAGCRSHPGVARRGQTQATPAVAQQVSDKEQDSRNAPGDLVVQPQSPDSSPAELPDKQRKRFGDLFRRNREPDAVPLPTTPISDEASPLSGPVEDFQ